MGENSITYGFTRVVVHTKFSAWPEELVKRGKRLRAPRVLGILFHCFSVDGLQLVFVFLSCCLSHKNASYA